MESESFNLVIIGVGGQGQLTLLRILAQAALIENYDFKTSELHGLSQRGGSVEVHIRLGKKVFSPLVSQGGADLILALEFQEALRALYYCSAKTKFLINNRFFPVPGEELLSEKEILKGLKKFTKNWEIIEAANICKKALGKEIFAGVYLLTLATKKKLIPLKLKSILEAIKKTIPGKYLESNIRAFNLAKSF